MGLLNKAQILAADRRKTVEVNVKEWGGKVRLQELSADERDAWENLSYNIDDDGKAKFNAKQVRSRLLVRCIVGEDGRRMFTDDEVAAVGSLSASAAQKLFEAAMKLNAISKSDIEELEGNSAAGPSGAGSST